MNLRTEWNENTSSEIENRFYSREETVANVRENFDIRRMYSAEGFDIEVNGVVERCLVQTSSNPLRELNDFRKIQCPMTADIKRGYYVKYEGAVWIIDTNVVNVDRAYWSTRMSRCQYVLRWQNKNGQIVERWAYASDQTKYSNGETGNSTLVVGDNQYGLLIAIDSETKQLKRNMRFAFDFDDAEEPDIYELTNRKIKLAEGTMQLSFAFDAFNKDADKRVALENGDEVWICNYHEPTTTTPSTPTTPPEDADETTDLRCTISGGTSIRVGRKKVWTAKFVDADGNEITDQEFTWNVVADFEVTQTITNNKIQLIIDDDSLVDESFLLQIIVDNSVVTETEVTITESY